jgi:hypothetical protein
MKCHITLLLSTFGVAAGLSFDGSQQCDLSKHDCDGVLSGKTPQIAGAVMGLPWEKTAASRITKRERRADFHQQTKRVEAPVDQAFEGRSARLPRRKRS